MASNKCDKKQCGTLPGCSGCTSRNTQPTHNIKHVIGIMSGKGGVGKSSVASQLAILMRRKGFRVGIMDADITGPSIPHMLGVSGSVMGDGEMMQPLCTEEGIAVISINLLLEDTNEPVIWRGSMIANVVGQFWNKVLWGELDYLFIDLPPGTGDVPLTVFKTIPMDGVIIVTTPQQLVSMIVRKAVSMAKKMGVNIIGIIENMSYALCHECGERLFVFGKSRIEEEAAELSLPVLAKLAIDPETAALCDEGKLHLASCRGLNPVIDTLLVLGK